MPSASSSSSSSGSGSKSSSGSGSSSSSSGSSGFSSRNSASPERPPRPVSKAIEDVPMPDAVALPPPPVKDAASGDVEMKDVSKSTLNVGHDKDKPASKSTKENGRAASPEPRHKTKLTITHLTRNVKEGHIREIFANFGELKGVDLPLDPLLKLPRGFAYVEYVSHEDAVKAQVHMDGGQLDGKILAVEFPFIVSKHVPMHGIRQVRPSSPSRRPRDDRGSRSHRDRLPIPRRRDSPVRRDYRRPISPSRRRLPSPPRRSRRDSPRRRSSPSRRGRLPSPPRDRDRDRRRRRSPSPRRRRDSPPPRRRTRSPVKREAERKPAAKRRSNTPSSSSSSSSQSSSGSGSTSSGS